MNPISTPPATTDDHYEAWRAASVEESAAYRAWCAAASEDRREAYAIFLAAADRASAAADALACAVRATD
jgi:hypothetical protein